MAIHKLQVFLSSRFDEFNELRARLREKINGLRLPPAEAVDLNDNAVDSKPPLSRCFEAVDRSELFVLLVGDTYGDAVSGRKESYTHLEHKRALNDESITVFPFLIGSTHHKETYRQHYTDPRLGEWIAEIRKHHTPSYLDPAHNPEQLANQIFDQVRDRLVELSIDVDDGDLENVGDDADNISEDTPINLGRLETLVPDKPNIEQPLRVLAANHAKEALGALKMGLPPIAIQHLRQAVDLVPLDIVLGYWLSRLLIATGRLKQCAEGRRVALLCARIAAREENERQLETMACYVLAARASERLGDLEEAKSYAKRAHDDMPYHWMAKLEYGRQLIFAGEKGPALELLDEAFWLRPDSLRHARRDVAYRSLTSDFDRFLQTLKGTVKQKTQIIEYVESRIQDFAKQMAIREDSDESARTQRDEHRTIFQLVNAGRSAGESSFQMLQQCAKKISTDAVSFEFDQFKGLTPEIKECIEEKIETAKMSVADLVQQERQAKQAAKEIEEQESTLLLIGACVGGGLVIILMIAVYFASTEIAVIVVVMLGLGIWTAWQVHQTLEAKKSKSFQDFQRAHLHLTQAKSGSDALRETLHLFESTDVMVRTNVETFCDLVDEFERAVLGSVALSPVVPIERKGSHDVGRVNATKAVSPGMVTDDALLPNELRYLREASNAKTKYWIGRRVRSGEIETLSRSAAYFR